MSDNVSYIDESTFFTNVSASPAVSASVVSTLPEASSITEKKDVLSRLLKGLIAVLILFLTGEIVYYLCIIPAAATPLVTIEGLNHASRDDVFSYAESLFDTSWLDIDSVALTAKISRCPLFENVNVSKVFPDKVVVTVKERTAVAATLVQIRGKTVPVQIDAGGYVFDVGDMILPDNCVMISGLDFSGMNFGDRISPQFRPLLSDIAKLQQSSVALFDMISEIKVEPMVYGGYELVIFPAHEPVKLRAKGRLNVNLLEYMMLILDVVKDVKLDTDELDFRAGTVAYQVRGGVDE